MKKLTLTLITIVSALVSFAQPLCNPSFTLTNNPSYNAGLLNVTFNRTNSITLPSGNPNAQVHFNLDFGDNTSTTSFWGSTDHNYSQPGTYTATLTMTIVDSPANQLCTATYSQQVTVNYPPCAVVTSYIANSNGSYTFSAVNPANTPGLSYTWDFGDGTFGTGATATHTYAFSGVYMVNVLLAGAGCSPSGFSNTTLTIIDSNSAINCNNLHANFSTSGDISGMYFLNNSTYPPYLSSNIKLRATWDFGDGSPLIIGNNVFHTYGSLGNYTVALKNEWVDSTNNIVVCTDTITHLTTVSLPQCKLSGTIYFDSTIVSSPLNFKVWLIKYDNQTNTLNAIDSTITSFINSLSSANYHFNNVDQGTYYVKARVEPGLVNPGFIPTYYTSSVLWTNAAAININANLYYIDITMQQGIPSAGPGFISGNVSQGAGKGTSTGIPNLSMLLRDASNNVVASTYTDVNGDYSFGSLANGSYSIYPEEMNSQTTPSANLIIGSGVNTHSAIDFEKNSTSIKPKATGVKDVANKVFSIYPNPTKGQVNINWKNGVNGDAQLIISDIFGRVVYSQNASTTAPAHIQLSNLNQGVYFIKVNTAIGQHTERVVLQ